ncbi:DMT family transporter [Sulfitobacter aestuarii]|uniref:DMT family transporter n=1 Tax=Sulfitobacter aestuarii TaxID=2161676 RepID=A0ABW5TYC8_9RHOB
MLFFSALVAGSFSLGALVANDISPIAFTALRFCLAALLVGAMAMAQGGMSRRSLASPWRHALLGGLFAIYFVLMFEGLKTAPPVSAAAVFTLVPLMVAGFAYLLLRQRLTARISAALAIGGAGALWVIFRADLSALLAFDIGRGELIYFIGCISHALYAPLVRRLNRGESPAMFGFGTFAAGAVLLLIYGWPMLWATDWSSLPPRVWVTLFYVTFFASAVTIVLLHFATLRLPSAKVMAYTYLTPSWVIVWEIMLGHGAPGVMVLGGVILTMFALLLLLRDDDPQVS